MSITFPIIQPELKLKTALLHFSHRQIQKNLGGVENVFKQF